MVRPNAKGEELSFLEHLLELRSRFFLALGALLLGTLLAHFYHQEVLQLVLKPAGGRSFIFLSPLDPLFFILKLDFLVGFLLSAPLLSWLSLSYLRPALSPNTHSRLFLLSLASVALLLVGFAYAYWVTVPLSLKYLLAIALPGIQSTITAQSYLNFFLTQTLLLGLIFQIPLILLTGLAWGAFTPQALSQQRPYVYLAGVIALAVLTPTTDLFNLGVMLLPAAAVFELSLGLGRGMLYLRQRKVLSAK